MSETQQLYIGLPFPVPIGGGGWKKVSADWQYSRRAS